MLAVDGELASTRINEGESVCMQAKHSEDLRECKHLVGLEWPDSSGELNGHFVS